MPSERKENLMESAPASSTPEEATTKAQIRYFGSFRATTQKHFDDFDIPPGTTAYSLLQAISEIYGEGLGAELFDEKELGGLREDLMMMVNGTIIVHEKAAQIMIDPGDVIALYPTFPGGG